MTFRRFAWAHGSGEIHALGGMLAPLRFTLPSGRAFQPFHIAPWAGEPGTEDLPAILQNLRGEWPCLPFGAARRDVLQGDWAGLELQEPLDLPPHGISSNAVWSFASDLDLVLDYPQASPIARLERQIRPDPERAAVDILLRIHAREAVTWPLGLHPTFRLPASGLRLHTDSPGMVFPAEVEPKVSRLTPGARFASLAAVPGAMGALDLTRLPLPGATEELVQLTAPQGQLRLTYVEERAEVRMDWDEAVFPGLLIWLSNGGRSAAPWNSRHFALGLEPVCAAFDLGPRISAGANPLNATGHPTAYRLPQGVTETRLRLSVREVPGP